MRDRLMELLKFAKSINSERVELQKDEYIYLLEFMGNAIVTPCKVGQKMENLNAEQVKKDLQKIVDNYSGSWTRFDILSNALALITSQEQMIGELTRMMQDNVRAENEELRKSNECDVRRLKTDTVKDFHKRFYEKLAFMNTINKGVPKWDTDEIQLLIVACGAIADQVKDEMLEVRQNDR